MPLAEGRRTPLARLPTTKVLDYCNLSVPLRLPLSSLPLLIVDLWTGSASLVPHLILLLFQSLLRPVHEVLLGAADIKVSIRPRNDHAHAHATRLVPPAIGDTFERISAPPSTSPSTS